LKKREVERAKKEEEARLIYLRKQEEENRRTLEAERMIAQLEREERELIERLKKTQTMQQQAYEELQECLEL
jgi:tRNA uridine 5-carbamoylmethylation protein Kti12